MKLSEFKYDLPSGLISLYPAENRDESRMMVVHRESGTLEHKIFKDIVDYMRVALKFPLIIWGAPCDRMHAIATGFARAGMPVIMGPESAFAGKRFRIGNKWDWERYWFYDAWRRTKRIVEPGPPHLIVPVETKEEAIVMAQRAAMSGLAMRDMRVPQLEAYLEWSSSAWGEWPDDWHLYTRSGWEMPLRHKAKMLKILKDVHGWEVDRLDLKKMRHPDGRLLEPDDFYAEYSTQSNIYPTLLPRLFPDVDLRKYKDTFEKGVK